jgi:D-sedoheptulose 7-phosphate isomerase
MKGFYKARPVEINGKQLQGALPAIALTGHTALSTAFLNDVDASLVFAQQAAGYGRQGDVLLCISTSGNSVNVVNAAEVASALGLRTVALTGEGGGRLREICDVTVAVPSRVTAHVQELHLPVYHALCAMLEARFFKD